MSNSTAKVLEAIQALGTKASSAEVVAKVNEVIEVLNTMIENQPKPRDRGPDSTREMTEDDARRILLGDLKDTKHKDAAETLGLSYGQVYSARKGFTFKKIYKESLS